MVKKGIMTMATYIADVCALLNSRIAVGESFKESKVIFIVVGDLGAEYAAFVTSLTTRFDSTMKFFDIEALLMD